MKNNPNSKKQNLTIANKDKEYGYVMASTLNQMINYIPLKMKWEYKFTHIYNVTLIENVSLKKFKDNASWDENFCKVEKSSSIPITDILIEQADWVNIAKVIQRFEEVLKLEKNPIFWNITGGQRPFLLAVLEFTRNRPKDIIAYLEGNSSNLVTMQNTFNGLTCVGQPKSYAINELTINKAFQLMGFDNKDTNQTNFLTTYDNTKKNFYINKFYNLYTNTSNRKLRELLSKFNDNKPDETARIANYNYVITEIQKLGILTIVEMKQYWDGFQKLKAFGYILEEMAAYLIVDALERNSLIHKIAEICTSTKITGQHYTTNKLAIDEFDILLLTKTGKLINFECKSGNMSGDNAKSNSYSTYAVSGVYGSPILISPALESEVPNGFIHDSVKSAYNSAKRANLEVWCIDEIETKIKEKLK